MIVRFKFLAEKHKNGSTFLMVLAYAALLNVSLMNAAAEARFWTQHLPYIMHWE